MEKERILYPKTFIALVAESLDKRLEDFSQRNQDRKFFTDNIIEELNSVIGDYYKGCTEADELKKLHTMLKSQYNRKKKRWLDSLLIDVELDPKENPKRYPFYDIWNIYNTTMKDNFKNSFGLTFEELIKDKVEAAKKWAKDENALLIEFPAIYSLPKKRQYDSFRADLAMDSFRIICNQMNYDISSYTKVYTDDMSSMPIFAPGRRMYHEPEGDDNIIKIIPTSEDGREGLLVSIKDKHLVQSFSALDEKDRNILSYITQEALKDPLNTGNVTLDIGSLARVITNRNSISSKSYDEAEARCYKIVNHTYNYFDEGGKQRAAINLLSGAVQKEIDGKRYMDISLGETLTDAVLNHKLRRIPSRYVDSIDSKLGRIIIFGLQKERVKAYNRYKSGVIAECFSILHYTDFMRFVQLTGRSKGENMRQIKGALTEYIEKGIFIRRMEVNNLNFSAKIWWIPLSDEEYEDMNYFGFTTSEGVEVIETKYEIG